MRRTLPPWLPLYAVLLLAATLSPLVVSTSPQPLEMRLLTGDTLANVLLFVPLGAAARRGSRARDAVVALLAGLALSAAIESAQRWLGRTPSLGDLVANTAGATLGALVARTRRAAAHPSAARLARAALPFAAVAATVAICLVGARSRPVDLGTWEAYDLALGNEEPREQPWGGVLESFELYDRDVTRERPAAAEGTPRAAGGPVVRVDLRGTPRGTFDDGAGPRAITLPAAAPAGLRWGEDGLRFDGGRLALPDDVRDAALAACRAAGRCAFVLRLRTDASEDTHARRVAAFSNGWRRRNLAVMQEGAALTLLVRHPQTGVECSKTFSHALPPGVPLEVVAASAGGVDRIDVDGRLAGDTYVAPLGAHPVAGSHWAFALAVAAALAGLAAGAWSRAGRGALAVGLACGVATWAVPHATGAWTQLGLAPWRELLPALAAAVAALPPGAELRRAAQGAH